MLDGEAFVCSLYVNGHVLKNKGVPISSAATNLDTAAAQFKAPYERMHAKAGLPKPQR